MLKDAILENKSNSEINWLAIYEYIDGRRNPKNTQANKYDQLCYQILKEFEDEIRTPNTFCLY